MTEVMNVHPVEIDILSADDIRRALPMPAAILAVRDAFDQLSAGRVRVPPRINLAVPPRNRTTLVMPAFLENGRHLGLKVINLFGDNPARGLPLIHALVMIFDGDTGQPRAIMDGSRLTALRTGAASGVATDELARPDAATAAIFGAGHQARTQLEAVCAVRPIRRARVFDPEPGRAAAFAAEMAVELDIPVEVAVDAARAAAGADVICTATTAGEPVFPDTSVNAGTHINAIGAYTPVTREIPGETVARATVVMDSRTACLEEAGDLLIPLEMGLIGPDRLDTEIGDIIGGHRPGRQSAGEITLFKSVGVAVQDIAVAARALEAAQRLGLGSRAVL